MPATVYSNNECISSDLPFQRLPANHQTTHNERAQSHDENERHEPQMPIRTGPQYFDARKIVRLIGQCNFLGDL